MKHIILLLTILMATAANAQNVALGLHSSSIIYLPFNITSYTTLDSSRFIIRYDATYPRDDVRKGKVAADDIVELLVGDEISKFHSYNLNCLDRSKSFGEKTSIQRRQDYVPYQVYTDIKNGNVEIVNRCPFNSVDKAYSYNDTRNIEWIISEEMDSVASYPCRKASCSAFGRHWDVWFTTDIPVSIGPWRLGGLPGMIMKAQSGEYSFTAKEVLQDRVPITKPKWQYSKISRKDWLKLEKGWHDSPYFYFTEGGKYRIFNVFTNTDYSDSWTIPYDAIEKE